MNQKEPKPKKCKVCPTKFIPRNSMQKVCGVECAIIQAKDDKQKKFDKETRRRKEALRSVDKGHWMKKAQAEFNKWIRLVDADQVCISCGRIEEVIENTVGGKWDCGHFRSVGAQPQLRFHPMNAHKQCKSCNGGSSKYAHKGHTVAMDYRINLRAKIGTDWVEWLEREHPIKNYTVEDFTEAFRFYQKLIKEEVFDRDSVLEILEAGL